MDQIPVPGPDGRAQDQALMQWMTEVEERMVRTGAPRYQAQEFIDAEFEWLADQFYDAVPPDDAAQGALDD